MHLELLHTLILFQKPLVKKTQFLFQTLLLIRLLVKWESKVLEFEKKLPDISFSIMRIGLVLSNEGGIFNISKKLSMLYALSPLGRGNQWQSWIHIDDASSIFLECINNTSTGVFNLVAPNPVVQSELLQKNCFV